jgi:hypothetical protein
MQRRHWRLARKQLADTVQLPSDRDVSANDRCQEILPPADSKPTALPPRSLHDRKCAADRSPDRSRSAAPFRRPFRATGLQFTSHGTVLQATLSSRGAPRARCFGGACSGQPTLLSHRQSMRTCMDFDHTESDPARPTQLRHALAVRTKATGYYELAAKAWHRARGFSSLASGGLPDVSATGRYRS